MINSIDVVSVLESGDKLSAVSMIRKSGLPPKIRKGLIIILENYPDLTRIRNELDAIGIDPEKIGPLPYQPGEPPSKNIDMYSRNNHVGRIINSPDSSSSSDMRIEVRRALQLMLRGWNENGD